MDNFNIIYMHQNKDRKTLETNEIKWTILLIGNIKNKSNFNYLLKRLKYLIDKDNLSNDIEILYNLKDYDITSKRKDLIKRSNGEWISFINEDEVEDITDEFIIDIYNNLEHDLIIYDDRVYIYNKIVESKSKNIFPNVIRKSKIDDNYFKNNINLEEFSLDKIYIFGKYQPSFSIIVTAYQSHDFIEDCLDSIENQNYFIDNDKFEVLVGVDGCEKTLEKIKKIKHKYRNIKILMMDSNMGTYVTSNTLLDQVKYDNIIRFDSDDIMKFNMIHEIKQFANDYDIIRFGYDDFVGNINNITNSKEIFYPHGVVLYKKSVFDIAGGYKDWICGADTELIKRVEDKMKIKMLKSRLFFRRQHPNSLTRNKKTNFGSNIRNNYRDMIGKHHTTWINKKTNTYKEY